MFGFIKNGVVNAALKKARNMLNLSLEGICVIDEIVYRDKKVTLILRLAGLEDRPIEIKCENIKISPDGANVEINRFESSMPFVHNALERFIKGKKFAVPESARSGLVLAKKTLGL